MLTNISFYLIFGKPLIMYLGITTLLSFLFTASIGYASLYNIKWVSFKWHPKMAAITIFLAVIHGILGIAAYL